MGLPQSTRGKYVLMLMCQAKNTGVEEPFLYIANEFCKRYVRNCCISVMASVIMISMRKADTKRRRERQMNWRPLISNLPILSYLLCELLGLYSAMSIVL